LYVFRILSKIEENIIANNFDTNSEFITKDKLAIDYDTKSNMIDNDELQESQAQSINATASVINVTMNEDIPSFREWTKKQLEEAEKQPGINIYLFIFYIF